MADTQSLPEKRRLPQDKLFFCRLWVGRRRRRSFGELDAPDIFFGLETHDANLIGLVGADMPNPDDAESGFAP